MTKLLLLSTTFLIAGCKRNGSVPAETKPQSTVAATAPAIAASTPAPPVVSSAKSEWRPETVGLPIDLAFTPETFSFCDQRGPRQVSLATGAETSGTQQCPKDDDQKASRDCPDELTIYGGPNGGGNDTVTYGNGYYLLKGQVRACAGMGSKAVLGTYEQVLVVEGSAQRSVELSRDGGERVAISDGWVAWRGSDKKDSLHVRALASLPAARN